MRPSVYSDDSELGSGWRITDVASMRAPRGVVMCAPTHYDVVDVKNPFMEGQAGKIDRRSALRQWQDLRRAFARAGATVFEVPAAAGCEDMVFCANPVLLGLDDRGATTCIPGRMTYPSRQPEVAALTAWSLARGYRIVELPAPETKFEGGGDALWHPGRRLLWGGHGWRTGAEIYPALAEALRAPVIAIELVDPRYYHLDTCLCLLDERTALVYPPAIAESGLRMIRRCFDRVLEVDAAEAGAFACNAATFSGGTVIIDARAASTADRLRSLGYTVIEVDTGEFIKSGGSVYCMKNAVY
jgi:N-dimethylarginine dimethylaminohydrolase